MANFISVSLPHDLPEDWTDTQYVSPGGLEVGLTSRHGYNYMMQQINNAQVGAVELAETISSGTDNLIDNWYFPDPVNRKGGYCVLADTEYYSDKYMETPAGVLTSHSNAIYVNHDYGTITLNGVQYYVLFTDMYEGYVTPTAGVYSFDRWWSQNAALAKTKSVPAGITLYPVAENTNAFICQAIPNPKRLAGRRVILSVLVSYMGALTYLKMYKSTSINAAGAVQIASKSLEEGMNTIVVDIPADVGGTSYPYLTVSIETSYDGGITIAATKLQLGSRQTLAYQDASNNWLLRDIPNKVIETVRCNGAPVDIGGQGMIVTPADIGLSTANVLADAEVI